MSSYDSIVNWTHTMVLKAKTVASKLDNSNCWETMRITFDGDYWKADCKDSETLEKMWEIERLPIILHT